MWLSWKAPEPEPEKAEKAEKEGLVIFFGIQGIQTLPHMGFRVGFRVQGFRVSGFRVQGVLVLGFRV